MSDGSPRDTRDEEHILGTLWNTVGTLVGTRGKTRRAEPGNRCKDGRGRMRERIKFKSFSLCEPLRIFLFFRLWQKSCDALLKRKKKKTWQLERHHSSLRGEDKMLMKY